MAYQYKVTCYGVEDEFYLRSKPNGNIDRYGVVVWGDDNETIFDSFYCDNEDSAYQWLDESGHEFDCTQFIGDVSATLHKRGDASYYDVPVDIDYKLIFATIGNAYRPY